MTFHPQALVFGVLAGAASALLAGSVLTQTTLAVLLFHISAFPIIAAGLAFGPGAAITGALVAALLVAGLVSGPSALVVLLTTSGPAALATALISLALPADEIGGRNGDTVWFPLADTVFFSALAIAAGFVVLGAYTGYSMEFATGFAAEMQARLTEMNPEFVPSADFAPSLAAFVYRAVPVIIPAMMTLALMASLYLALAATRPSGRFARPRDDWPQALRMPKQALVVFAFVMAVSFFSGPLGLVATAFCGAIGAGFASAGVAMLHHRTRGRPGRGFILMLAWLGLFLFLPVIVLFLFMGLFDTTRAAPVSRAPGTKP
jgi:hypothetical protein